MTSTMQGNVNAGESTNAVGAAGSMGRPVAGAATATAAAAAAAGGYGAGNFATTAFANAGTVQGGAPSASLYVGELHGDVTEAMLYELFSQVGPVSSIRICRDAITRRSLGYAYVNFHNVVDCERALDTLNYTPIKGQPCRIMWSQRDPAIRRSGVGNIFIKNLDLAIDNKALHDTFSAFGNILSCKVVTNEMGESRGYGYVHFETNEAAQLAIEKVNGMLLNGKKVFVGHHIPRKARSSRVEELQAHFTNVFVKNLDELVEEDQLRQTFERFGEIQSVAIQRTPEGKSRGFGFVNYVTHEAAQAAVDELNESELATKQIYVGRAQKKMERLEELRRQFEAVKLDRLSKFHGVNLYIKNLDEQVDEERLRMEFTPFGSISSAKIMSDENGRSRGFGFVCYTSPEEASKAITAMNGKMIFGKPIYVALAQRRDERRAQLEAQFSQRAQQLRYQQMAGIGIYQQGPLFYQQQPGMPSRFPPAYVARPGPGGSYGMMPPANGFPAAMMMGPGMRPMRPVRGGFRPPMGSAGGPAMNMRPVEGGSSPVMPMMHGAYRRPYNPRFGPNVRSGRPEPFDRFGGPMLTTAALASAAPEQQKRIIGERLYPLVQARDTEHASKITGMLLEMDNGELLHMLESPEALTLKVSEAQEVLRQHQASLAAAKAE